MSGAAAFRFEVQSGLYSGLSGEVAEGSRLIGSGFDADMVFVEQELQPHHLRVTLAGDSLEVEALAERIGIEDHGAIPVGERVVVALPAIIHAGAISIRWSIRDEMRGVPVGPSNHSVSTRVVAVAGFLVFAAAVAAIFFNANTASMANSPAPAESVPKLAMSRPDDQSTRAAARALQEEIDKAGLLNIRVAAGPGVVTAEGTVAPSTLADWQKLQQWFDRQTNGALALVNGVAIKEEKPPSSMAVEAVWRGTQPYLLVRGQKYFVGALVSDGWIINKIEDGRVLLSRNGRFAAVPY